jgi:glycosyltransferase involved in cell wall biosynthesis
VRVVQLGKYYYPYRGGIESHLFTLANELKRVVDVDVVVSNTGIRTTRDVVRGVSVTRCGSLGVVASASLSPTMALELSARDYDVLHIHLPHPVGAASYLASRKPKEHRLVVTYHSDVVRQKRLMRLYAPVLERLLDRADVVLATSPDYLESSPVLRRYRQKCAVVPLGIDLDAFARTKDSSHRARAIRESLGGKFLLLGVGRLIYYKGFEFAIRALPSLPDTHLALVGDGPLRSRLEALAHELGVRERVHLLGELSDAEILAYYHASDLYVLPSIARSEAFGIVQVEAMACELPVINTQLDSGVPFVSRHGESGLTVPPADPHSLASAVRTLLEDAETRRRMGQAGRRRAEQEFSKEALVSRILQHYAGTSSRAPSSA